MNPSGIQQVSWAVEEEGCFLAGCPSRYVWRHWSRGVWARGSVRSFMNGATPHSRSYLLVSNSEPGAYHYPRTMESSSLSSFLGVLGQPLSLYPPYMASQSAVAHAYKLLPIAVAISLLGCYAVWLLWEPTFRRILAPPSGWQESVN
jgi:hypothetical protein